jgi:hypothetical protein
MSHEGRQALEVSPISAYGDPTIERSGYRAQPAISFSGCTQQAPADRFLNECEGLFGFTCLGFGYLRTELHRREPIFSGFDTRLGLL